MLTVTRYLLCQRFLAFFRSIFKIFWNTVDLQCCASFRCTTKWFGYPYTEIYTFFLIHTLFLPFLSPLNILVDTGVSHNPPYGEQTYPGSLTPRGVLSSSSSFFFFFWRCCWCKPFLKSFFQPRAMWDLSSPTRNRTHNPCIGRQSPNHWTTREVLGPPSWKAEQRPRQSSEPAPLRQWKLRPSPSNSKLNWFNYSQNHI